MNISSFIANRIAFNRQRSFSRFIIRLSIIATIISVAVMIITLAFANGFQQKVSEKVFSFWGHIRLQEIQFYQSVITEELPITANDTLITALKNIPEIETIHPFATRYAILKTKDDLEGVLVKGLDSSYNFNHIRDFIIEGNPPAFNDSSYSRQIMISKHTADQMKLKTGDRVLIYFIRPDGSQRPDRLTITGIFKTGIEEYDKTFAIGDIKLIRRLNDWLPNQVGGYEIFLTDYKKIDSISYQILSLPEMPLSWSAQGIQKITPNIFDWLNMQDVTRNVLIAIMVVVAVINLITCLIILVLERMRMIGILKAIGASDWAVQRIFLRYSLIITLSGIVVGVVLALGILYLQVKTGFIKLQEDAYYLDKAAVKISAPEVLAICAGTFLVCMLVLMIPTYIVRKVQPVKAIHFR
ncbi:MAG: ABC transporter permease [Sphingobacteriales bacterium]|nr:ABC transporter permease [Sphingobacteriales bacterium]